MTTFRKKWGWGVLPALLLVGYLVANRAAPVEGAAAVGIELAVGSTAPAHQDSLTMPPALLRRLAAAAEGFPGNGDIWLVADPDFPHDVLNGFFTTETAAEMFRDANDSTYGVYGPLDTDAIQGLQGEASSVYFLYCRYSWSPYCQKPGGGGQADQSSVDSVRIIIYQGPETPVDVSFPSDSLPDAVFFNMRGYDRYLHPYYIRLYGVDRADFLRDSMFTAIQ